MFEPARIASAPPVNLGRAMMHRIGFRAVAMGQTHAPTNIDGGERAERDLIDEAYSRGIEEGQALAEISHDVERRAWLDLLSSAEAFNQTPCPSLAELIAETVRRLVHEMVGAAPIDEDWLQGRVAVAAEILTAADNDRTLWLHPLDAALVEHSRFGFPIAADPELPRGSLRIETGSGWVEHGRNVYLDALDQQLASARTRP